jgi:serralysin
MAMPTTVNGTNNSETLDASDGVTNGSEDIYGHAGNDTILGLGGDDHINGGEGADHIDGGAGEDTAYYHFSKTGVTVSLLNGAGIGGEAEGDTLVNVENLIGSEYDDILVGNDGRNEFYGGKGHDILKGGGGDDDLHGEFGNDTLKGGGGADNLWGGAGIDTAAYDTAEHGVFVSLGSGTSRPHDAYVLARDIDADRLYDIEDVIGSEHDDVVWGDHGANTLAGLGGNDELKGGGGADILRGGNGHDDIIGGAGRDVMFGDAGADTFVWKSADETGLTNATADIVRDFNRAQGDRIDLSMIDADVYGSGNQAFTFIGTGAFSGTPGEVRYYHSGGSTFIAMQTGTSTDVEGVIRLDGIHTPEANWFVL